MVAGFGENEDGAMVLVEEFRGNDADDALVESGVFYEKDWGFRERFLGDFGKGGVLEGAALGVEVVEDLGAREGGAGVGGEKELEGGGGGFDTAGGV